MRAAICVILAWLLWPGLAAAESIDGRKLNALMAHYYETPDPSAAIDWLSRVEARALAQPRAVDLVATFLSHVLRAAPLRAGDVVDRVAHTDASGPLVLTVATAVWLADLPERQLLLTALRKTGRLSETEMARLGAGSAFDGDAFMPQTAHDLDLCWVSFYATGDSRYIEKVARHLPYLLPQGMMEKLANDPEPGAQTLFERGLVARAAAWSLASHARQHPRVRQALDVLATREEKMGKAVKALLEDVFRGP